MEINEHNNRFFGITIGPIGRIMSYTKPMRSIWAASYFFSWLAEGIVSELFDDERVFLKPDHASIKFGSNDMVGRFPDQYVFVAKDGETIESVRAKIDNALSKTAKRISGILGKSDEQVSAYLKDSLRITLFEYEMEGDNMQVIKEMQDIMGVLDCQDSFKVCTDKGEELFPILFSQDLDKLCRLYYSGEELVKCLKGYKNLHKIDEDKPYVAFVKIDGDNFGKNNALISPYMNTFYNELNEAVQDYGGLVLFQGGDDISFYAPITKDDKSCDILSLVRKIDILFDEKVLSKNTTWTERTPSLSYGIALGYEKHPMRETMNKAEEMLEEAKRMPGKNAVCWELRKHSGQIARGAISKNHKGLFERVVNLVDIALQSDKEEFLHSITHGIVAYQNLLDVIFTDYRSENGEIDPRLDHFFSNVYDVRNAKNMEIVEIVKQIIADPSLRADNKDQVRPSKNAVDFVHNILRYIELLIRKERE